MSSQMETFDDLQMPFPLFRGPIAHAVTDSAGDCNRCDLHAAIRFDGLCYSCFRHGLGESVMDTELGMVTKELAKVGMTHGLPMRDPSKIRDYQLTPHPVDPNFPDEAWYHFHVDADLLNELLRTPRYHTWQGEQWQFCCLRPMVFRGSLPSDVLANDGPDVEGAIRDFLQSPDWQSTVEGEHGHYYYLFTCGLCGRLRYHEDCD